MQEGTFHIFNFCSRTLGQFQPNFAQNVMSLQSVPKYYLGNYQTEKKLWLNKQIKQNGELPAFV